MPCCFRVVKSSSLPFAVAVDMATMVLRSLLGAGSLREGTELPERILVVLYDVRQPCRMSDAGLNGIRRRVDSLGVYKEIRESVVLSLTAQ